jgi:hypothetical protein
MAIERALDAAAPAQVPRNRRRASPSSLQCTLELTAIVAVITYVTMLLTVRLHYSIDSVPLYGWLECLVLLAPVIPILTRLTSIIHESA